MSYSLQQQIKNNATELRQYVNDLYQWEQEKEELEKVSKKTKAEEPKEQKIEPKKQQPKTQNEQFKRLKRDVNTVSDYYKAWDKFDVDAEINKAEREQSKKPYNPYQNSISNIRAKPKAQMAVKGGRGVVKDPTSLKDRGNLHFKTCQYQKAIQCYTQCLQKLKEEEAAKNNNELKCIVYSNRAMCHLKLSEYREAYDDSTASLQFDQKYVKSYLRRATALKKMKKYRQALKDFNQALQLDSESAQAQTESKRIKAYLSQQAKQARDSMVKQNNFSTLMTERITIEEVEEEAKLQKKESNYLQEL